jgi:hypothetical protein
MAALNYATSYQQALDQEFPYVLNFGALYSTPNNNRYKWEGAKTIQIPTISTKGRVDADRDTISLAQRNYDNSWTSKVLENFRKWSTLVHPQDINETNFTTTIANITQVYNEEQKFPEMDAYCISKIYSEWTALGNTGDTTAITAENVLDVFNSLMLKMDNKRVPNTGRILYVTPETARKINMNKQIIKATEVKTATSQINTDVTTIDLVKIVTVPPDLMGTLYDFTQGWAKGVGWRQINMALIHPLAVITPTKYSFAQLDPPSAGSEGKWVYYEESYEDVFVLTNKADGIQFNLE